MKALLAIAQLAFNVIKGILLSGLATARVILSPPDQVQPGLTRMPYGELEPGAATLLGGLICLTPGTTTVTIDLERREFLLDLRDREEALASIHRDFVTPMLKLRGGRR